MDPPTTTRRWRGLEPAERDNQRRERLLEAGLELFGTKGYRATSIEELCASANVATRALYDLFGSRDALLLAVYDRIVDAVAADLWVALEAPDEDVEAAIRRAVAAFVEPMVRDERKGRVVQLEVVGVSAEIEAHRRAVVRRFATGIDAALERWALAGLVAKGDRGLLTLMLAGGVTEALVDHLMTPKRRRRSVRALVDEIARVWLLSTGGATSSTRREISE